MYKWLTSVSLGGGPTVPMAQVKDAVCNTITKRFCAENGLGLASPQRHLLVNQHHELMDMKPMGHQAARALTALLRVKFTSVHVSPEDVLVLMAFILGMAGGVVFLLMDLRMHPKCKFIAEFCLGLGFAVIGRLPYMLMKIQQNSEVVCPAVCDVFVPAAPALPM